MVRKNLAIVALGFCLTSCTMRSNDAYIDGLAALVVRYQERHGSPPDRFEAAHQESGVVLPNRGDVQGRPLSYIKCPRADSCSERTEKTGWMTWG